MKIHSDEKGLYVQTNMCIYRPGHQKHWDAGMRVTEKSVFKAGQVAKGGMISQSPLCRVKVGDVVEIWAMERSLLEKEQANG